MMLPYSINNSPSASRPSQPQQEILRVFVGRVRESVAPPMEEDLSQ